MRQSDLKTLCSDSQLRIIHLFFQNCNCEYYYFLSLHERSKLEKRRPSKQLRQSPIDDKLIVTIPMDLPLSTSEMSILNRGLSFISTPHTVDEFEIVVILRNLPVEYAFLPTSMKILLTNNLNHVNTLQPAISTFSLKA